MKKLKVKVSHSCDGYSFENDALVDLSNGEVTLVNATMNDSIKSSKINYLGESFSLKNINGELLLTIDDVKDLIFIKNSSDE